MIQTMEWPFYYRTYPERCIIQFKPCHDKGNHFSIVWPETKGSISHHDFQEMDKQVREYLARNQGRVSFTIIKACANCTYGRFDEPLETMLLGFRDKYKGLNKVKNLPVNDPQHQHLKDHVVWDETHPIAFHIHHRSADADFTNTMKGNLGDCVVLLFEEFVLHKK